MQNLQFLEQCYAQCEKQNLTRQLEKQSLNSSLTLVCREDTVLVLEIVGDFNGDDADDDNPVASHKREKFDGRLYVVTVQQGEDKFSSKVLYIVGII